MLAATTSTWAAPAERDITCDGAYRIERVGYCHLMDHKFNQLFETDFSEPVGIEKVWKTCEEYERCVIRARVVSRGFVEGQENYTVLKVYSARLGSKR
jgi:hypothetical protein